MSARFPLTGLVGVLMEQDVDTDIIYPARFLLITEKRGLGRYAFSDRRSAADFPLPLDGSRPILVAGANFGCGSSREHAVWALRDFGIRAIIAPSFGEIFYTNCTRNGIVPIRLPQHVVAALAAREGQTLTVDLQACRVMGGGIDPIGFDISAGHREALLNGWDETDRIIALYGEQIDAYERRQQAGGLWL